MTRHRLLRAVSIVVGLAALGGCAPAPEPLGRAAVFDTAAPSEAPSSSTTSAPAGPGGPIDAKVLEVAPSTDGSKDMHASITFDNAGDGDCHVQAYTLEWPGGKKTVKVDDFVVHGHATAKRSMKMHPDDGKLETLDASHATVTLKSDCPGSSASTR